MQEIILDQLQNDEDISGVETSISTFHLDEQGDIHVDYSEMRGDTAVDFDISTNFTITDTTNGIELEVDDSTSFINNLPRDQVRALYENLMRTTTNLHGANNSNDVHFMDKKKCQSLRKRFSPRSISESMLKNGHNVMGKAHNLMKIRSELKTNNRTLLWKASSILSS